VLQWVFYVTVVTAILAVSAWMAEHALRGVHWATRWIWMTALAFSVALAYLSATAMLAPLMPRSAPLGHAWQALQHVAPLKLPQLLPAAATAAAYTNTRRWNISISAIWVLCSALVAMAAAASGAQVFWRRRKWPMRLLHSACVGIAPDTGPAVVGLLRPTIVIPQWVLGRAASEQALILAHEQSHLEAHDPLLLTAALVAVMLMPWNIPLWWQLQRLRHAIEVDCDARVLCCGHDTQTYGEALIEVAQRRSRFLGAVAAMAESRTLLETRIEIMTKRSKPWTYGFAALCILAVTLAAAATQIAAPAATGDRQEISVDSVTLDRYVGKYRLGTNILTITRAGTQLNAQLTGQPTAPIYAETPTQFFWKVVDAQVTFSTSDSGPATSATLHQAGMDHVAARLDDVSAQALEQQISMRISQQTPQPGSEAALRRSILAMQADPPAPIYGDMTPALQTVTRPQVPAVSAFLKQLGPLQSIEFAGVTDSGADKYLVTHQSGKQSQWTIVLDPNGKIAGLLVAPKF
jgi:beta-lactamase regulating signal transducer with metallopeptidase domain